MSMATLAGVCLVQKQVLCKEAREISVQISQVEIMSIGIAEGEYKFFGSWLSWSLKISFIHL